jgi:cyclohexadienyl dehydratase
MNTIPLARTTLAAIGLALATAATHAGPVLDRVKAAQSVRVCIWPDYYGVTFRNPRTQQLGGIDVDLSAEFGRDLKAKIEYVETSFPKLVDDLKADRCDVAMFAVAVLPARAAQLAFSKPYLQSDIYGITTKSNRVVREWADIDKPGVQVAVQAGTFMEPVMAQALKQATMVVVKPPATRERRWCRRRSRSTCCLTPTP